MIEIEIICFESLRLRYLVFVVVSVVENGRFGVVGGEGVFESVFEEGVFFGLSVVVSRFVLGFEMVEELVVFFGIVGFFKVGSKGVVIFLVVDSISGGVEGVRVVEVVDFGGVGEIEGRDVFVVKVVVFVFGVVGNGSVVVSVVFDVGVGVGDVGSLFVLRSSVVGVLILSIVDGGFRDVVENV